MGKETKNIKLRPFLEAKEPNNRKKKTKRKQEANWP